VPLTTGSRGNGNEDGTEARSVPQALEPLPRSRTLADGLVRVLDAVVLAPGADGRSALLQLRAVVF
jgi:hypothetical protein